MTKNCSNEELRLLISACIARRYTTKESLVFLKSHNCNISERTFFQKKIEVKEQIPKQVRSVVENLVSEHLRRINELEQIDRELWLICTNTKDDNVRLKALNSIRENQSHLSEFIKNTLTLIHEQMNWFKILPLGNKLNVKKYLEEKRMELETPETISPHALIDPFPSLEEVNRAKEKRLARFLEAEKLDQINCK